MLLLEATEPVTSSFPLEVWVPAVTSLLVSLSALVGVVWSNFVAARREERRAQAEREHERERWVRDQKATLYAALTTNLTDQHDHFVAFVNGVWTLSESAEDADLALSNFEAEEKRLRASARLLGAEAVTAALSARAHFVGKAAMDAWGHRKRPDLDTRTTWHVEESRLTDVAIDAMQRDLGIVLPEEPQEKRQGGDDK